MIRLFLLVVFSGLLVACNSEEITSERVGSMSDKKVMISETAVLLMGGGPEVDEAFRKFVFPLLRGGDILVLRERGGFAYNSYFLHELEPLADDQRPNSVETIVVDSRPKANSPRVSEAIQHAELIWIAGGSQSHALHFWRGTELQRQLSSAIQRGVILGGTSSGTALLGGVVHAPPIELDGVTSEEALADPFHPRILLHPPLVGFQPLSDVVTDMHIDTRRRIGRLATFLPRAASLFRADCAYGLGLDERTALFIQASGLCHVISSTEGNGRAYVMRWDEYSTAITLEPGRPLDASGLAISVYSGEDRFWLKCPDPSREVRIVLNATSVIESQLIRSRVRMRD